MINKSIILGRLGADPDVRTMQSGDKVANLNIATSESWKDAQGQKQERTQWHKVVVFNQGLVKLCENHLKKGAKIYIEGQLETRSWEKDGIKQYATEVVLRPFKSEIVIIDWPENNQSAHNEAKSNGYQPQDDDLEDSVPF